MKSVKLMLFTASKLGMNPYYFPVPLHEIAPRIYSIASVRQTGEGQKQICQEQHTAAWFYSIQSE